MADLKQITERVQAAINIVRPYLQNDGGDISLIEVTEDMVAKVKLLGACGTCPYSLMTLKNGVEQAIRRDVPEIKEVVAVNEDM
ncbi:NifU family protein [Williamwhitmania taraxaci]|uniref:Fe-S cluster biogenesis protein NfuA, 4Fe-4S-binding domain n=1 Tax=Williamwhitmania taraxaci TaxID=1640674 RepID=A0A1G6MXW9_9BACT|nr:NifU family protein [Williamwhitmania taraxaci]SDC60383.1 Fe-S cluster biogenesis protein NfuA, 4Fe-4S-binding domain [Williamwhitmania taraxaci]